MKGMINLKKAREGRGMSQRGLARLAGISYRSLQLIESGAHDPRISTIEHIAKALGYPPHGIEGRIDEMFSLPCDSVAVISARIAMAGEGSWRDWLFNFVDAFRSKKDRAYLVAPPADAASERVRALLASVVESMCSDFEMPPPGWCSAIGSLDEPWFVSGVESLKAEALIESPVHFRARNIFVLGNFLDRG